MDHLPTKTIFKSPHNEIGDEPIDFFNNEIWDKTYGIK